MQLSMLVAISHKTGARMPLPITNSFMLSFVFGTVESNSKLGDLHKLLIADDGQHVFTNMNQAIAKPKTVVQWKWAGVLVWREEEGVRTISK